MVIYSERGLLDSGASAFELLEKDVAYAIAVKVRDKLVDLGADVRMTRNEEPVCLNLSQRVDMANDAGANIFVSIHANSHAKSKPHGTSSWFYAPVGDNNYNREVRAMLAQIIQYAMSESTGLSDHGVCEANFIVTRETVMPSVLLETAFISNPDDNAYLSSESGKEALVQGIVNGITEFLSKDI